LIFSGSVVVDRQNTAGFGENALVAIFTSHNMEWEKAGRIDRENQSIAFSNDHGYKWTKYAGNPVLKNPGIADFRDPNVSWYAPGNKWIMALATQDRETFYSSKDLKTWTRESDFGVGIGAHGGVWECPDLFSMEVDGQEKWVLLVSINPGAPNGGSGTQYFVGDFDGHQFVLQDMETRWIDYGRDNYAGVTFHETDKRRIFMGWMSNWDYATVVPTKSWRSANTLPRDLALKNVNGKYFLSSTPIDLPVESTKKLAAGKSMKATSALLRISAKGQTVQDFAIDLANAKGEHVTIGYEKSTNRYFVDRRQSGDFSFSSKFSSRDYAPRISQSATIDFQVITDVASAEMFADGGLTTMTTIYFPSEEYKVVSVKGISVDVDSVKPIL
jgi:fructan beta-fructosidase